MATSERRADQGSRVARKTLIKLGEEVRRARLLAGLSQSELGRLLGLSASTVSRMERALLPRLALVDLARAMSVVGLELSATAHPAGQPVRDAAHLSLLGRLRESLPREIAWHPEFPVSLPGDKRAWDALLVASGVRIGVEAETRLRDVQALERRITLKARDSGLERVVLLVADTRTNRRIVREYEGVLRSAYPISGRKALEGLRASRDPGGSALVLL